MARTITVAGALAQRPDHGGHAWVFLQYLLGLRSLGYDVCFVDHLDPVMCVNAAGRPAPFAVSHNVQAVATLMDRVGLGGCWAVLEGDTGQTAGLSRAEVAGRVGRSDLLINVMGYLDDEELLAAAPLRLFLDIDPGFGQLWRHLGWHDLFVGHDRYATVGTRLGAADSSVPTGGIDWIPTLPPVDREWWPVQPPPADPSRFTTVASWRGPFGPIEFEGRTLGLRVHEFRRFADLPLIAPARFDVALDIDAADSADRDRLSAAGWGLSDPRDAAGDAWRFRRFVQESAAEVMIAKQLYVATRGGWFSDRTACYLASGRPVLAQDTGFGAVLPTGAGIVTFTTPAEAAAGAAEIVGDYTRHAAAAAEIAAAHLDARTVLAGLLDAVGATS